MKRFEGDFAPGIALSDKKISECARPDLGEFHQKTGICLDNLDSKEQELFMSYQKNADPTKQEELMQFIATHGENGLKTFLSLEQDQKMGGVILSIGEQVKEHPQVAANLFERYSEIIGKVNKLVDELSSIVNEVYGENTIDKESLFVILFAKANGLLLSANKRLEKCTDKDKNAIIESLIKDTERELQVKHSAVKNIVAIRENMRLLYINARTRKSFQNIDEFEQYAEIKKEKDLLSHNSFFEKEPAEVRAWAVEVVNSRYKKMREMGQYEDIKNEIYRIENELRLAESIDIEKELTSFKTTGFDEIKKLVANNSDEHISNLIRRGREKQINEMEKKDVVLRRLLPLDQALKDAMTSIIYDKTNISQNKVVQKFSEIIDQAKKSKQEMSDMVKNNLGLDDAQINIISDNLIVKASSLLSDYTDRISRGESVDEKEMMASLDRINARVELTKEIIGQLPRESVAQLDLSQLSDIERHIDLKAEDLAKMPELMEKMEKIVENNFTEADREAFSQYCLSSENNGLTVTTANGEVLSFFLKKRLSENLSYLSWFSTNPDAPIKGLGEATVLLGFNHSQKEQESFYAVAKPHVKSYGTLIEKLGFVGFGKEEVDEYDGNHYARTRKILSDFQYSSKNFSPEQNVNFADQIKNICLDKDKTYALQFENKEYLVCSVSYDGYTHKDDITREDEDGWLYQEIEKQFGEHRVLTRYIPASSDKNNATYYAVFEKDSSTQEERKELDYYLISSNLSHSDSKKSVNS